MKPSDLDFVLRESSGLDPQPPRFTTAAWLKMVDAEVAAAGSAGRLLSLIGNFEEVHRGEPFVWDDEIEERLRVAKERAGTGRQSE